MTRNFALRAGLAWLALASLLCACATPRRTSATGQNPGRFTASIRQDLAADYLLFLPRGYDPSSAKRWPLLIFLHGAGERGS
ncbi:MAG: hypothetical protein JNL97_09910, partial [Verrucomicrobiales bacterium]|nr:hypothetical protein [Verrucomicrobiales bacterium]